MTAVATQVHDAIVDKFAAAMGAGVSVFKYRGEADKDMILSLAKRLPAVGVSYLGVSRGVPSRMQPQAEANFGAYIITKQSAGSNRLSNPADAAAAIEQIALIELLTGPVHDEAETVEKLRTANMHGEAGPMGAGFGFTEIRWQHKLTLPPQDDPAALAATVADLQQVTVELDFADVAPDGEDPPDGTVDHTMTASDLDV